MTRSRWILLFGALGLVVLTGWLWWVRPGKVDMAAYAPADSLLYLEANQPLEVAEALTGTDAWKAFARTIGPNQGSPGGHWLQSFVGWTGIGPIQSVILTRAQVAVVVTDLGTAEAGDTLKVTAEAAILVETHTSTSRIRPPFEQALKELAEKTYGRPTSRRVTLDGLEFVEWVAPDSSRQMVGTVVGSLLIIGTSQQVVQSCLAVSQGRRPALRDDPELKQLRLQLGSDRALSFGYVPAKNSARLLAVGIPVLFGRAPGDSEFQRLVATGATKVFGSVAWSSRPHLTGIEDRYLIGLQPSVVTRLKPHFRHTNLPSRIASVVPNEMYSVTSYKFAEPAAAWQSLKTAVSSQVDALSSIVFSTLLKSALLSYGIGDPEGFLAACDNEILTLRLDEYSERSILIAGVRDANMLRELLKRSMAAKPKVGEGQNEEMFEDAEGEFGASLTEDLVVIGSPSDLRRYATAKDSALVKTRKLDQMAQLSSTTSRANIVTYTNDESRVYSFFAAIKPSTGTPVVNAAQFREAVAALPYSVTETVLGDSGLERTTRSPLGQFSTLVTFLIPEPAAPIKDATPPR